MFRRQAVIRHSEKVMWLLAPAALRLWTSLAISSLLCASSFGSTSHRTNFPTNLCVWDRNRGGVRIVPKGNGSKNTDENSIVPLCMNFILSEQITLDWYYGVLSGADPLQDPLSLAYFRSRWIYWLLVITLKKNFKATILEDVFFPSIRTNPWLASL